MKYHAHKITCPKCKKVCSTIEVSFRADYKVYIEARCFHCGVDYESECTIYRLIEALKRMELDPYSPDFELEWFEQTGPPS